jgi:hypothetical protein
VNHLYTNNGTPEQPLAFGLPSRTFVGRLLARGGTKSNVCLSGKTPDAPIGQTIAQLNP